MHSTRSDGARTPEETLADYRARGYDFVSLTDHFLPEAHFRPGTPGFVDVTDTRAFDTDDFVTILGAEVHGPAMENGQIWHLVANGLPVDFPPLAEGETGLEVASRAAEAGAFVSLAHPHWNGVSDVDALQTAEFIHSVEIYNHASEVGVDRGYGLHQADVLLGKGHRVTLNAADDAHGKHPEGTFMDAFGGWVMVKAPELTPEALVGALKAGEFYSTQGPELHAIEVDGDVLRIECSPASRVVVSGKGAAYQRFHGVSLMEVEAKVPDVEKTPYVRITVIDEFGRHAWSNPVWLEG